MKILSRFDLGIFFIFEIINDRIYYLLLYFQNVTFIPYYKTLMIYKFNIYAGGRFI